MSRIGNKPVPVPNKVTVTIDGQTVTVKGPKGELSHDVHPKITVEQEDGSLLIKRGSDEREDRALHGLTRALLANMITGVNDGFRRELIIEGVGYQGELRGTDLAFRLGYSHEIVMTPPPNVKFAMEGRTRVIVEGIDKQVVGQVAANIRELRPPEPYLGKGVRYADEKIRRKAGKTGK